MSGGDKSAGKPVLNWKTRSTEEGNAEISDL
jgi:hypothetical protein